MSNAANGTGLRLHYVAIVLLGIFAAVAIEPLWSLSTRWFVAGVGGVVLLTVCVLAIRRLPDFLFVLMLFCLPLAGLTKWLFYEHLDKEVAPAAVFSGLVGVGPMDVLLIGLYLTWFVRIFFTRAAPLPRLEWADVPVLLLIAASGLSPFVALQDVSVAVFGIEHLIKHAMFYFYVSRNFENRHVRWLVLAILFAILLEGGLGIIQNRTGRLAGLMIDKGAGDVINFQPTVPGIESVTRATGTALDSHALGLYFAMLAPFVFVPLFSRAHGSVPRAINLIFFGLAMVGLLLTFSRSGWVSFAVAMGLAWLVLLLWRERDILPWTTLALAVVVLLLPLGVDIIRTRLDAPPELLSSRFDQYRAAYDIWRQRPLTGVGLGNYVYAVQTYSSQINEPDIIVHNVFLLLGVEMGALAPIAFYWIAFGAMFRLGRVMRARSPRHSWLALAVFTGLVAFLLDGLTNPLFREPVVYAMFWVSIGLSVALQRLQAEATEGGSPDPARQEHSALPSESGAA